MKKPAVSSVITTRCDFKAEAAGRITVSCIDVRVGTSAMAISAGLFGANAENGNRVSH